MQNVKFKIIKIIKINQLKTKLNLKTKIIIRFNSK